MRISASGYEPLRQTPVYHGEVSAGRSFDGGDGIGGLFSGANAFSAVITAVYHDDWRGIDDVEESYTDQQSSGVPDKVLSNLQFRRYEYHRQRYGVAANFDAKASESTSLYLRLLWSGYVEGANKHYLVLNNLDSDAGCSPLPSCIQDPSNPNGFIASGAGLEQDTTDTEERIQNGLGVIGGSSVFSNFKLDYHASFALGTDRVSTSYGSAWTDPNPVPIAYDNNTDPRLPALSNARRHGSGGPEQLHLETASAWGSRTPTMARRPGSSMSRSPQETAIKRRNGNLASRCGRATRPANPHRRSSLPTARFHWRRTPTDRRRSTTTISTISDQRSAWCRCETSPTAT